MMLFKIVAKRRSEEFDYGKLCFATEKKLIEARTELEKVWPGWTFYFHPVAEPGTMYSTGSFRHIPIEERKK